ncbi:MAG TPA: alpha/beta fold hydrolase, partial [Thermomicrobiales bacterium]|nr:alpha/beta fold hydrolase [Thermomicrobiales bacterium]
MTTRRPRPLWKPALAAIAALAVVLASLGVAPPVAVAQPAAIARHDFTVKLDGISTAAEATYPADQTGPFPTVLVIAGSGPFDMDFTIVDPTTGKVRSAIFRDIADYLSARGFAVVRYDKRYITKPNDPQEAQTFRQRFTLPLLLSDAERVYAATGALPQVDPDRIVLYGWSEGSTIATQLALRHPEIAGLVVQGPVAGTVADVFRDQALRVGVGFLRDVADADHDGAIALDELLAALRNHPATAAGFAALATFDLSSSQSEPRLNPATDRNGDGRLDIDGEVVPALDDLFAHFDRALASGKLPYGPQYATDRQLPPIATTIGGYHGPVLILQGESDANVPPEGAL